MNYQAQNTRYKKMRFQRCGKSGLLLPRMSLGLWHNFGDYDDLENGRLMLRYAFDQGITHFDLANNYGPPPGSAEANFGKLMKQDLLPFRDELIISSKAGYLMWPGPYGEWGSRKYLVASLDQSLKRMGLDYVDIFYSHRPDPNTPLEETMGALDYIVRSGRALYVGISSYDAVMTHRAASILRQMGTPCIIHQPSYNMFNRWIEETGTLNAIEEEGMGCIVFSPLAQGMLTDKYLNGIPEGSRASKPYNEFQPKDVNPGKLEKVRKLKKVAEARGQSMPQLALSWVLRDSRITSALIGASKVKQIEDSLGALSNLNFDISELEQIETILKC